MDSSTIQPRPLPPVGDFLNQAWVQYGRRAGVLLGISIIANAFFFISPLLNVALSEEAATVTYLILLVPALVASAWGNLALLAAVAIPEKTPTIKSAFRVGGPYFLENLTTSLLFVLIVAAGLIIIVPGIYYAVAFFLGPFLVIKEGSKNMAALRRSQQLITGRWWRVLWRNFVLGLVISLFGLVLGIVLGVLLSGAPDSLEIFIQDITSAILQWAATPLSIIAMGVMYEHLHGTMVTSTTDIQ